MNILAFLIGSNPLPNYVVCEYLLNDNRTDKEELPVPDTLIMLHSKGTKDFANNILNVLGISQKDYNSNFNIPLVKDKKPKIEFYKGIKNNEKPIKNLILIDIDQYERNSNMIINGVVYTILGLIKSGEKIDSVHLNNTAGTKPMAVYSTLGLFLMENKIKPIFTDIDPNIYKLEKTIFAENKINYDISENNKIIQSIIKELNLKIVETKFFPSEPSKDLRDYVKPNIKQILQLHSMEEVSVGNRINIDFSEFKKEALSKKDDLLNIRYWCNKIEDIERNGIERENNGKKEIIIKKNITDFSGNDIESIICPQFFTKEFLCTFKSLSIYFTDSKFKFTEKANSNTKKEEFEKLMKPFMGEWLEEYIALILKEIQKDFKNNFEIKTSFYAKTKKLSETEIDVIVRKSFQLYIITCTTWDKLGAVKGKVFEALYRSEQLGGGNSKVISVSLLKNTPEKTDDTKESNIKNLRANFLQFDADKNVRYIGLEDLQNEKTLKEKLKNWIFDDNWNYGENKAI